MEKDFEVPSGNSKIINTGSGILDHIPRGTHFCQFYHTTEDLLDIALPYVKSGLEAKELCLWVTSGTRETLKAKSLLVSKLDKADEFLSKKQLEILGLRHFLSKSKYLFSRDFLENPISPKNKFAHKEFDGIRLLIDVPYHDDSNWKSCSRIDEIIDHIRAKQPVIALCSYCLNKCTASEIINIVSNHPIVLVKRKKKWEIIENRERKHTEEALILSREEFSKALQASPDSIVISTLREGRFIDVNDSLVRTTGYDRSELIGRTSIELGFWERPQWRNRFVRRLKKNGVVKDLEVKFRMKHGEFRTGLLSAQLINIRGELCSIAILHDITERKGIEEELRRSREELRNLSVYLQRTREEERTHIAREIHDELGQALTALKMDLSWLGKRLPRTRELLVEKVGSMSNIIDSTTQTLKNISTRLRPGLLDDLGLVPAIEWLAQQFQERTHTRYDLDIQAQDVALDPELATTFFRIFQETLTNIARHASATRVKVKFYKKAAKLILQVSDNGAGITEAQIADPKSIGLLGMRERARFWGGDVKISGSSGKGTVVTVNIPLRLKEIR